MTHPSELVSLEVRERDVSELETELGSLRRWDVRDASVVNGVRTRTVLQLRNRSFMCSCGRQGCRDVDAVRATLRPAADPNPCLKGDGTRALAILALVLVVGGLAGCASSTDPCSKRVPFTDPRTGQVLGFEQHCWGPPPPCGPDNLCVSVTPR